jgi:hypothetical protein
MLRLTPLSISKIECPDEIRQEHELVIYKYVWIFHIIRPGRLQKIKGGFQEYFSEVLVNFAVIICTIILSQT